MPHESTVNPNDYMGNDMSNMVNRINRGLNLSNLESNTISDPSQNNQELTQKEFKNFAEFYEKKTINSPVTDRNRSVFYGSESGNAMFGAIIKKKSINQINDQLLRPETPSTLTHFEDLDEDDETDEPKSFETKTCS